MHPQLQAGAACGPARDEMSELCELGAVELRSLIGRKEVSPLELLDSCLARIDAVNPSLNAMPIVDNEGARAAARRSEQAVLAGDELGLLHGLPLAVKDLNEAAGLKTSWGSPIYADHVSEQDERLVAAVRGQGAVVLGKTNTPEFGAGANTVNAVYGATRNPFDLSRTCGGSSGGSAVALATSMAVLCTGSDTGGSLRIPAAYSGVVGLRPSPGMVPSERRVLGWSPLSVEGPMARSVSDLRLLFLAQRGTDSRDPLAAAALGDSPTERPADLASLRVAVSEDLGFARVSNEIRETFRKRTALLERAFASFEQRDPELEGADEIFEAVRAQNFLAEFHHLYEERPDDLGPNVRANYEQGLAMSALEVAQAHRRQTILYRRFQRFFEEVDLLISPTVAVSPFPLEQGHIREIDGVEMRTYFHWLALTYGLTLTTHPCISIPCGLDSTGMPFGLQITGPVGSDLRLLDAAQEIESFLAQSSGAGRPVPDLRRLLA